MFNARKRLTWVGKAQVAVMCPFNCEITSLVAYMHTKLITDKLLPDICIVPNVMPT